MHSLLLAVEGDAMDTSIPEEVLLDENEEAAKYEFYMVGGFEVSPDHRWGGCLFLVFQFFC